MKAYYLVFILALLFSLFFEAKTDRQWRWKLFFTFLPLFIFGAIRVDFGNDYTSYLEVYERIHSGPLFEFDKYAHVELGYQLLNMIMPSFRSILVLNAFLLSFSLAFFCYHNVSQRYLWIAVVLIFLNPEKNIYGTLVAIRSGLCVSSFLLGSVFIQKRKWLPFLILSVLMGYVHTSALLFMPIAFLVGSNKPFSSLEIWIWVVGCFIVLFTSMTRVFDIVSSLIDNDVFNRYESVLSDVSTHRGLLQVGSNMAFIVMFILYMNQQSWELSYKERSLLRVGILFSISLFLGSLSTRASYFYDMFFIASVVKVATDKKADSLLRISILTLAIATSYYSMFRVWMGSPWWDHSIYHSLLGSW